MPIIRPFEEHDTKSIKKLVHIATKQVGIILPLLSNSIVELELDQISQRYRGRGGFWVAVSGGEVIGTIAILEQKEVKYKFTAKLECMVVHPLWQGNGIAKALHDHAIGFAIQRNYTKVIFPTYEVMRRAHGFCAKMGYRKVWESLFEEEPLLRKIYFEKEI